MPIKFNSVPTGQDDDWHDYFDWLYDYDGDKKALLDFGFSTTKLFLAVAGLYFISNIYGEYGKSKRFGKVF